MAEVRAAKLIAARRVARLERRSIARYVTAPARIGLGTAAALCLLAAVIANVTASPARITALIAGVGLPPLVLLVARHVALRPQSTDTPDLLTADEAIRANSLQALYAAALTLMLYAAAGLSILALVELSDEGAVLLTPVAMVGIPVLGWLLGRQVSRPEDPVPITAE